MFAWDVFDIAGIFGKSLSETCCKGSICGFTYMDGHLGAAELMKPGSFIEQRVPSFVGGEDWLRIFPGSIRFTVNSRILVTSRLTSLAQQTILFNEFVDVALGHSNFVVSCGIDAVFRTL